MFGTVATLRARCAVGVPYKVDLCGAGQRCATSREAVRDTCCLAVRCISAVNNVTFFRAVVQCMHAVTRGLNPNETHLGKLLSPKVLMTGSNIF